MTSKRMLLLLPSMVLLALCSAQGTNDEAPQEEDEMPQVLDNELLEETPEDLQGKPQGEDGDQSGKMSNNRKKGHGLQLRPYNQGGLGSPYSRWGLRGPGGRGGLSDQSGPGGLGGPGGQRNRHRQGSRGGRGGRGGQRERDGQSGECGGQ